MMLNANAIKAAATGYRILFHQGRTGIRMFYPDYAMTVQSGGDREVYQLAPLGASIREWTGDRRLRKVKMFDYTLINADYEGTVVIPRNAFEDDVLGHFNGQFIQLGMEATKHPDELLAALLADGFTEAGYDGVPFFSNSHLTADGANNRDNLVSGALDATKFQEAFRLLEAMVAYNGKPLNAFAMGEGVDLIVSPTLRAAAEAIVTAQLGTGGATNTNYQKARLVVNPYITSTTAWYLAVRGGAMKPFISQRRREPELVVINSPDSEDVFYRKQVVFGVDGRYTVGYGHPELIIGSTGT